VINHLSHLEKIGEMSQMRVDLCAKLPVDHPLQPPIIDCLQSIPADAEGVDEQVESVSANTATSSQSIPPTFVEPINFAQTQTEIFDPSNSQPNSPTKLSEPNVLKQLVSHYSGELPEVESELQKASKVASDEVASESPQQQSPNQQTASTKIQIIPDHIESMTCTEEVSEPEATDMEVEIPSSTSASDDISETSVQTIPNITPTIPTNDHPSPSNLALQPIPPPKPTKIPFPPTMYLDSSLVTNICENIFQELNRRIKSRSDLIHQNSYEQSWNRLMERFKNVLNALQRMCMDDQDIAQQKLQD